MVLVVSAPMVSVPVGSISSVSELTVPRLSRSTYLPEISTSFAVMVPFELSVQPPSEKRMASPPAKTSPVLMTVVFAFSSPNLTVSFASAPKLVSSTSRVPSNVACLAAFTVPVLSTLLPIRAAAWALIVPLLMTAWSLVPEKMSLPARKSASEMSNVEAANIAPTSTRELAPKYTPFGFTRYRVWSTFNWPRILDGSLPTTRASMEALPRLSGWMTLTMFCSPMLKLCQLTMALRLPCVMSMVLPLVRTETAPETTLWPVGKVPAIKPDGENTSTLVRNRLSALTAFDDLKFFNVFLIIFVPSLF